MGQMREGNGKNNNLNKLHTLYLLDSLNLKHTKTIFLFTKNETNIQRSKKRTKE